jgi:hypothetical protein
VVGCNNVLQFFSFHPAGVQILLGDGSVRLLKDRTPAPVAAAPVTARGGETVGLD